MSFFSGIILTSAQKFGPIEEGLELSLFNGDPQLSNNICLTCQRPENRMTKCGRVRKLRTYKTPAHALAVRFHMHNEVKKCINIMIRFVLSCVSAACCEGSWHLSLPNPNTEAIHVCGSSTRSNAFSGSFKRCSNRICKRDEANPTTQGRSASYVEKLQRQCLVQPDSVATHYRFV